MSNEQNTPQSRDYRTGYGQTAYKRQLAYEHLKIDPANVPCAPFYPRQPDANRPPAEPSQNQA